MKEACNTSKKNEFRKKIAGLKKQFTREDLLKRSDEVLSVLEITGVFQSAKNIFIYNSLSDEVSTAGFIAKWHKEKNFFLPVVSENGLIFRAYDENEKYAVSGLGIKEPAGADFTDYKSVDLIIVPGIAFDRKMNRLGRGKGYYDKFLSGMKATKAGICFDFQLCDTVPFDEHDVRMDMVVSENDLIW